LIPRIGYRKKVGNFISGKRDVVVKKGEVMRKEHKMADKIEEHKKNPRFGFRCLHYSVSEGSGFIDIVVLNKNGQEGKIGVRTVDGEAKEGDDYQKMDDVLTFTNG
jgi:hypothetical protein